MADDTIPPATHEDFAPHLIGLRMQAEVHGLDLTDPNLNDFIVHISEVIAQKDSEVRWVRNILNAITFRGWCRVED